MAARNGWASSAKIKDGDKNALNLLEQERFLSSLDIDEIPVIPDIDDIVPEHMPDEIRRSAKNSTSIKPLELDSELIKHTSSVEGIDLSALARCLLPDEDLKEDDVPWTWNTIFVEQQQIKEIESSKIEDAVSS